MERDNSIKSSSPSYDFSSYSNSERKKSFNSDEDENHVKRLSDFENQKYNMDLEEEIDRESNHLNESELNMPRKSGMINDIYVPELVKEDPYRNNALTQDEIKEQFMKNNYQSNFSMGGGYDDIERGEKKYEEYQKQMNA